MQLKYSYTIIPKEDFGSSSSPARTQRHTTSKNRNIWTNESRMSTIPYAHRVFIILHEIGHNELNTSDEIAVDAWAQARYIEMGYPLSESVKALTRVLTSNSKENIQRCWNQYERARKIDEKVNKYAEYDGFAELAHYYDIDSVHENYDGSLDVQYSYFDLTELDQVKPMSRKEARKKKRSIKLYKKLQRGKKKSAVALDIEEGAKQRGVYAQKGIYVPTRTENISNGVKGAIQSVTSAFGGAFGGGAVSSIADAATGMIPGAAVAEETTTAYARLAEPKPRTEPTPAPKANNNMLLIGGGIAAVLVVGFLIVNK